MAVQTPPSCRDAILRTWPRYRPGAAIGMSVRRHRGGLPAVFRRQMWCVMAVDTGLVHCLFAGSGTHRFPANPQGSCLDSWFKDLAPGRDISCREPSTRAVMPHNAGRHAFSVPCVSFRLFGSQPRVRRTPSDPTTQTCFRKCASLFRQPAARRQVFWLSFRSFASEA